jgi:hypothetical protein
MATQIGADIGIYDVEATGGGGGSQSLEQVAQVGNAIDATDPVTLITFTKQLASLVIDANLQSIVLNTGTSVISALKSNEIRFSLLNGTFCVYNANGLTVTDGPTGDTIAIGADNILISNTAGDAMNYQRGIVDWKDGSTGKHKSLDFNSIIPTAAVAANNILQARSGGNVVALTSFLENPVAGTTYTLALTDKDDTLVTSNNAAATTFTVPTNASVAFSVGTVITLCQMGAGKLTVAAAGGVTVSSKGGNLSAAAQYVGLSLWKQATNTWVLFGDLIA